MRLISIVFVGSTVVSAQPGIVGVPSAITINEWSLDVAFENDSATAVEFLVANGIPPFELDHIRSDGTVVLRALFTCPLRHVHDCFHFESVMLEPGERRSFTLEAVMPDELESAVGKTRKAIYVTYRERPKPE